MKTLAKLFLFILTIFNLTSIAQVPTEVPIYGQFIFKPGLYNLDGVSPLADGKSSTVGSLLQFKMIMPRENSFSEVTTDVPSGWILGTIFYGFNNSHSMYSITLNNLDKDKLEPKLKEENLDLVFTKINILGFSQSFKVYDDFMLGYHLAWDGMASGLINQDREQVGISTLDMNYWNFAPVIAYQNDQFRVEAKYLFNRSKFITKGREFRLNGEYFIMNNEETLGLSVGAFVNSLNISTNYDNGVRNINMFAVGLSVSFIYPSVLSLIK